MTKAVPLRYSPVPLTYSAPRFDAVPSGEGSAAPSGDFYNAFPELNDHARDAHRLLSLRPRRAKYHLPLDGELLPTATEIDATEFAALDERTLATWDQDLVEELRTAFARDPRATRSIPKDPTDLVLTERFKWETEAELAHKRFAATPEKWWFRTAMLAPFYTAFEKRLCSGPEIPIPLPPDHQVRGLERRWSEITTWFAQTRLEDELGSLLVLAIIHDIDKDQEKALVASQEEEITGFSEQYWELRDLFRREAHESRAELAERVVVAMKGTSAEATADGHQRPARDADGKRKGRGRRLSWPDLVPFDGPRELRTNSLVLRGVPTGACIPEAVQRLITDDAHRHHLGKSYAKLDEAWNDYADFNLDVDEQGYYVTGGINRCFFDAIGKGITHDDGSLLDEATRSQVARYSIFIEAAREQVCTGVGLKCPFWDGVHCCEFRLLLEHMYRRTRPRDAFWQHHWTAPPCL